MLKTQRLNRGVINFKKNEQKIRDILFDFNHEKVFNNYNIDTLFEKFKYTLNRNSVADKEKQANYFSSYINDGTMDKFIKDFTKKQPKEYHNPYLKGDTRAEELYK